MNKLKDVISLKRLVEIVSMLILYVFFDAGGAKKYAVALLFCAIFLFLGRKKKWSSDVLLCVEIPAVAYVLLGSFSTLISASAQVMTVKILMYTLVPLLLAFSMYTFYGENMEKIIDVQFLGCILAYALFDAPTFIKIFRWESVFAFSFGIFALYYAYTKKWKVFVIAALFMLFAEKRIAILALMAALFVMGMMWIFRQSKKLAMIIWGLVSGAAYLYIYLIYSGFIEAFCWGANINTNGRVEMYGRMAQEAEFSLTFLGKGLGVVEQLLEHWNIMTYVNLHNDLLKFYVELGFWGLLIYLLSYGVMFHLAEKKFDQSKMSFLLVLSVYTMVMFTTDNVSIYMLYLVPLYSTFFAVLASKKEEPEKRVLYDKENIQ